MRYRFVVRGWIPAALLEPFEPIALERRKDGVSFEVECPDDASVYGVVDALERFGTRILELEQMDRGRHSG